MLSIMLNYFFQFFLFFKAPELRKLKITSKSSDEPSGLILTFLAKELLKLCYLGLDDIDFHDPAISNDQIESIKLPMLRNFSASRLYKPFQSDENFMKFMEVFRETLDELHIGAFKKKLSPEFYALVFSKLKKLKILALRVDDAPNNVEFYSSFEPNTSITTLIIYDTEIKHKKTLKALLSNLLNIERLIISKATIGNSILKIIASSCKKLKTFECFEIDKFESVSIIMPTVTKLGICRFLIKSHSGWNQIVKSFPKLETLSLHTVNQASLNEKAFKIFTKELKSIKHFVFGVGFKATNQIFNLMLANCKNLASVKLISTAFQADMNLLDKIKERFNKTEIQFTCYNERDICLLFDAQGISKFWIVDRDEDDDEDDDLGLEGVDLLDELIFMAAHFMDQRVDNNDENNEAVVPNGQDQVEINLEELD
jgi:hypothetical protein